MKITVKLPWLIWGGTTLLLVFYLSDQLLSDDKTLFLPGQTTSGHYQIELKCAACHGESFSDAEVMQKNCVGCHAEELKAVKDSHPKSKFTDPRNANRVKVLDARYCVTCHVEHKPEITLEMGLTQPQGYCIKCHEDVADDRPSHAGMEFTSCASAGCHNYHDNRALYEDYLVAHAREPETRQVTEMPVINVHEGYYQQHKDARPLTSQEADAPPGFLGDDKLKHDWSISSHASAGINCSGCHNDGIAKPWIEKPTHAQCQACHKIEVKGFLEGKHGMRLKADLPPMRPELARITLNPDKAKKPLNCITCHSEHEFNARKAGMEACSGCHQDEHSRNYKHSAHYLLWREALGGQRPESQGVSCATCHMPAIAQTAGFETAVATQHNQNANLRPNEKMIRSVCLNCHGLAFSIDALADPALVRANFSGKPARHIKSIDMAIAREK